MRSVFGNDIFRNEQYKLFEMQTNIRDDLKREANNYLENLVAKVSNNFVASDKLTNLFKQLIDQLENCKGKKVYGYLTKSTKDAELA